MPRSDARVIRLSQTAQRPPSSGRYSLIARCNVKLIFATIVVTTMAVTPLIAADNEPVQRLEAAAAVLSDVMATPDKGIPQDLLQKAHCTVIVPNLKTTVFVFGGKYGKGYLSCRRANG